jgi:hypothetical protein
MSILINTLLERIKREFKLPEPSWDSIEINKEDLFFLNNECNKESEFDPFNNRKLMYDNMIKGEFPTVIVKCDYGQILMVAENIEQLLLEIHL